MTEQTGALQGEDLKKALGQVDGWSLVDGRQIEKEYRFKDFAEALAFVNRLGEAAEAQGHHPDVFLTWGRVKVTLWTHSAGGLTASDFKLAARADAVR
jgi:4a-hydroxytetrahydrobiopterin dehydratase